VNLDPVPIPKLPERRRLGRRMRDGLTLALLGLLAFATGVTLFNNLIMPRLIHSAAEVRVPELSNLTYEQAEKLLAARQLRLGRSGERFDASVPRDFILAQDPLPDTPVRTRRRIMVMVSLGEEFSAVPGLVGTSVRGAALAIEHAGLGFAGTTRAPSVDAGEGMVVASDPSPDTVVPHNWPVAVLISAGAGDESYVMPDVLGRDTEALQGQLSALGFRVEVRGRRQKGPVIFQNPAPGSRIVGGTTVLLQAGGAARRAERGRR
jgi:serine/threonine-protein kinase